MSKFSINTILVKNQTKTIGAISTSLKSQEKQLRTIAENIGSMNESFSLVADTVLSLSDNVHILSERTSIAKQTLINICNLFDKHENNILQKQQNKFFVASSKAAVAVDLVAPEESADEQIKKKLHEYGYSDKEINKLLFEYNLTLEQLLKNIEAQGTRIGTVDRNFIQVDDGTNDPKFGGNQSWFKDNFYIDNILKLDDYGCGVIAAVNQYLYLTGQTNISEDDYKKLVMRFICADDSSYWGTAKASEILRRNIAIGTGVGALPSQITSYVTSLCKDDGVTVSSHWDVIHGYEDDYTSMKEQLESGIPVIWAIHDTYNGVFAGDEDRVELPFYTYDLAKGEYVPTQGAASHYVTVTGIYETIEPDGSTKRMIEFSSWGEKYYADFDEYKDYVSNDKANVVFSSITKTTIK